MKFALLVLLAAPLFAGDGPRLFYSKSFPGSKPDYVEITVDKAGAVEYREAPAEDNPLKFRLKEPETEEVFGLAEKLGHFNHPLEAPVKVAFMGAKTFRWDDGANKSEVKFNYSQDASAQALQDWFERMSESAQREIELERTVKYDKLGILNALIQLQISMDKKRIVGAEQYLPMLDRIIKNESFMHAARERASEIAEAIRAPKP
ncbi:MAG TPA: hypothetical protein VKT49_17620 [Bryobacteraceae bacterium]|nr:hypothetical protein [Bryobacteraceae bacterium]